MSPAAGQPQTTAPAPTPSVQRPKKFQVVPVPGEFTRGRWKCVDTRGGSTMGVFGNYPPDNEYKTVVSYKNKLITVRRKFYQKVFDTNEREANERVAERNTTNKDFHGVGSMQESSSHPHNVSPRQEVEVIIMSPHHPVTSQATGTSTTIPPPVTITTITPPHRQQNVNNGVAQPQTSTVIINSSQSNTQTNSFVTSSPSHVTTTAVASSSAPQGEEEGLAASTSSTVVAIDNKIVQAMDLVKTHLTFAVREEVESLRSTITDLENRLAALREENRILRENVSPEVLAFISANISICE